MAGHESAMSTVARRTIMLRKVSDPNSLVLAVAVPGSRYFIIVVTFTHVSGLDVFLPRLTCNPSNADGRLLWSYMVHQATSSGTRKNERSKIKRACK